MHHFIDQRFLVVTRSNIQPTAVICILENAPHPCRRLSIRFFCRSSSLIPSYHKHLLPPPPHPSTLPTHPIPPPHPSPFQILKRSHLQKTLEDILRREKTKSDRRRSNLLRQKEDLFSKQCPFQPTLFSSSSYSRSCSRPSASVRDHGHSSSGGGRECVARPRYSNEIAADQPAAAAVGVAALVLGGAAGAAGLEGPKEREGNEGSAISRAEEREAFPRGGEEGLLP